MDRINWSNGMLNRPEEEFVHEQISVTVYDEKNEVTAFQAGTLKLSSHRLFWHDKNDPACIIEFKLDSILSAELKQQQQQSFTASSNRNSRQITFTRIIVKFIEHASNVQFEFEFGGHNEFLQQLHQQLLRKKWTYSSKVSASHQLQHNVGIGGIQRKIQNKLDQQDQKISDSFKDLNILMNQAKEMVSLSNSIIAKISKNAAASASSANETEDDEDMKKLKNCFLSMGLIDNPVTKESSGSKYYKDLATEIHKNFSGIINDQGGIMTLAEVYCRLNRVSFFFLQLNACFNVAIYFDYLFSKSF
jgi:ESCRT-II complex subunit VPS36